MPIKNIIPIADGEGSLGLPGHTWGSGFFQDATFGDILIGGVSLDAGPGNVPKFGGQDLAFQSNVPTDNTQLLNGSNYVASPAGDVTGIYRITQANYTALAVKDPLTLYIII
tara:strand:- start:585 stop:920 length:336 start_codon:yes stop_codon:yes gene_type:complete